MVPPRGLEAGEEASIVLEMREVDPATSMREQLKDSDGPIVLVNTFLVPEGRRDEVLEAWTADARYMLAQPGCRSTQLHEGIGPSHALVNIAEWDSAEDLRAALEDPEFRAAMARYPDGTVASPHAYRKLAIDGICGD